MNSAEREPHRGWEYSRVGDYHRNLDPNWSYTPTYLRKMAVVKAFLRSLPKESLMLDAGCGEGVLVEDLRSEGYSISGIDLNYESESVTTGSVLEMPFQNATLDVILLLDVFEHLAFQDQPTALSEIARVLKPGGHLVASIPNLAHWNSRHSLFWKGRLDRTDQETNHVGERPMAENLFLLQNAKFKINRIVGITLTVPWLYRNVICRRPARWRWLHDFLEPVADGAPGLAMLNIFFCQNTASSS